MSENQPTINNIVQKSGIELCECSRVVRSHIILNSVAIYIYICLYDKKNIIRDCYTKLQLLARGSEHVMDKSTVSLSNVTFDMCKT